MWAPPCRLGAVVLVERENVSVVECEMINWLSAAADWLNARSAVAAALATQAVIARIWLGAIVRCALTELPATCGLHPRQVGEGMMLYAGRSDWWGCSPVRSRLFQHAEQESSTFVSVWGSL